MLPDENDHSVQPSSSDPVHSLSLTKVMEVVDKFRKELPLMVIKIVNQEIKPVVEGLLRKVVKEELQKLTSEGTWNVELEEKILHLKFLDEVSGPVLTSKEFKGMNDGPLEVALLDESENIVQSGPASSAEVEIVLIDENGEDNDETISENFERRIIKAGDKEKPHFTKNVYINLKEGKGSLKNQKLGQDKDWTKTCTCRLGARFVKDIRGLKVQKAWTPPFEVIDNRSQLYKKHETPSLDDDVWRIKEIGRDGKPRKRLDEQNIKKVRDFLFWLYVNPKKLQEILGAADGRWKMIVDHARTCKIDDKTIYCHKSSTEPEMGVIYNCVGEVKGLIDEYHFVPINNLSGDEKVHARKLLSSVLEESAFVDRYNTSFNDEASLVEQYSLKSSESISGSESVGAMKASELHNDTSETIPNIDGDSGTVEDETSVRFQEVYNELEMLLIWKDEGGVVKREHASKCWKRLFYVLTCVSRKKRRLA